MRLSGAFAFAKPGTQTRAIGKRPSVQLPPLLEPPLLEPPLLELLLEPPLDEELVLVPGSLDATPPPHASSKRAITEPTNTARARFIFEPPPRCEQPSCLGRSVHFTEVSWVDRAGFGT